LDVNEVARIGREAAAGLAAAHAKGLVHRDIKPANLILEAPAGRVKITDFGLARAVDDASVSQSGVVIGTPLYMAPEQARGEALDYRADLFSLGSVLYALCAGRPPFPAGNTMAVLRRVCEDASESLCALNPRVPPWLDQAIARLMAKNPADRFASAAEVEALFAARLGRAVPSDDRTAEMVSAPFAAPVVERRSRRPYLIGGAAVLVAAVITTIILVSQSRKDNSASRPGGGRDGGTNRDGPDVAGNPSGTTINVQFPNMEGVFPKQVTFPDPKTIMSQFGGLPWEKLWENHPLLNNGFPRMAEQPEDGFEYDGDRGIALYTPRLRHALGLKDKMALLPGEKLALFVLKSPADGRVLDETIAAIPFRSEVTFRDSPVTRAPVVSTRVAAGEKRMGDLDVYLDKDDTLIGRGTAIPLALSESAARGRVSAAIGTVTFENGKYRFGRLLTSAVTLDAASREP
jgi:hypothetical protein